MTCSQKYGLQSDFKSQSGLDRVPATEQLRRGSPIQLKPSHLSDHVSSVAVQPACSSLPWRLNQYPGCARASTSGQPYTVYPTNTTRYVTLPTEITQDDLNMALPFHADGRANKTMSIPIQGLVLLGPKTLLRINPIPPYNCHILDVLVPSHLLNVTIFRAQGMSSQSSTQKKP